MQHNRKTINPDDAYYLLSHTRALQGRRLAEQVASHAQACGSPDAPVEEKLSEVVNLVNEEYKAVSIHSQIRCDGRSAPWFFCSGQRLVVKPGAPETVIPRPFASAQRGENPVLRDFAGNCPGVLDVAAQATQENKEIEERLVKGRDFFETVCAMASRAPGGQNMDVPDSAPSTGRPGGKLAA